jgi:DNA repair protein RecN (Recombination protein N)
MCWKKYCNAQQAFDRLNTESIALKNEADFISFQLEELVKADLKEGELEKLESELKIQEHAEEIKTQFNSIIEQLGKIRLFGRFSAIGYSYSVADYQLYTPIHLSKSISTN